MWDPGETTPERESLRGVATKIIHEKMLLLNKKTLIISGVQRNEVIQMKNIIFPKCFIRQILTAPFNLVVELK